MAIKSSSFQQVLDTDTKTSHTLDSILYANAQGGSGFTLSIDGTFVAIARLLMSPDAGTHWIEYAAFDAPEIFHVPASPAAYWKLDCSGDGDFTSGSLWIEFARGTSALSVVRLLLADRSFVNEANGLPVNVVSGGMDVSGGVKLRDAEDANFALIGDADLATDSTAFALAVRVVGLLATLGEVDANPTANTVLARLKTIGLSMPASIGQKALAASFPVTLASDEVLLSRLPASLAQKAKAASLPVTLASDEDLLALLGAINGAKATASTGNFSLNQLLKALIDILGFQADAKITNGDTAGSIRAHIAGINAAANSTDPAAIVVRASATGSLTKKHDVLTASTNLTLVKASPGQIYKITGYNPNDEVDYLKFHDLAVLPTAGAGVVWAEPIAPASRFEITYDKGLPFLTGIAYSTTELPADNDTTAVDAAGIIVNIEYV